MKNKLLSSLLALLLIPALVLSLPVHAVQAQEETEEAPANQVLHIRSEDRFLRFAENCRLDSYSENLTVYLDTDLDLTGKDFFPIPYFQGTFEGNHHKITGLQLSENGSKMGLFRFLDQKGTIRNLTVIGDIAPEGTQLSVGGIVGENAGKVESCRFEGTVTGADRIGGIAGSNQLTGTIEDCRVTGTVTGVHFTGGIAGENYGVIRKCVNQADVNTSAQENTLNISSISLKTITGTESASTVTDAGGIAGTSVGVIRDCINQGDVGYLHMGYNMGGIAGSQSGFITGCKNHGQIYGRKDTGGIVGQFEPTSQIEYKEDTLQILEKQLAGASSLLNRASYNAQGNIGVIGERIQDMQEYSETARDAIASLKPGEVQDLDSLIAVKNTLHQSIQSMRNAMGDIGNAAGSAAGQLGQDLRAVSSQMSAMSKTIRDASEHLGVRLQDISDLDTEELFSGKVSLSTNFGAVSGDLNAGGIVGSIALENDLDPEDDLEFLGKQSANMEGSLRAVVRDSENRGTITAKKIHAGGIVGRMTLGLVKNCVNTGTVDAEKAQFVGGIAGYSRGYLRNCHVKCALLGNRCIGGIAGSGTVVSDCLSMVSIQKGSEQMGAILGIAEKPQEEEMEAPIKNNLYMNLDKDPGAIDGVSYRGLAEPLPPHQFQQLENLPETFRNTTLIFQPENAPQTKLVIPMGSILKEENIPQVPEKEGYTAQWKDLNRFRSSRIYFDHVFEPQYTPFRLTLKSVQTRENGRPVMLAEGQFQDMESIALKELSMESVDGKPTLEAWEIPVFSTEKDTVLHLNLPENADSQHLKVLIRRKDGSWEETTHQLNARYLVFSVSPGDSAVCVQQLPDYRNILLLSLGGAACAAAIAVFFIWKSRKKKQPISKEKQS